MMRCHNCQSENVASHRYCEKCGFLLSAPQNSSDDTCASQMNEATSIAYKLQHTTFDAFIPPPPPTYQLSSNETRHPQMAEMYRPEVANSYYPAATPPSEYSQESAISQTARRTVVGSFFSSILYIWGFFWLALGITACLLPLASSTIVGVTFCVIVLLGILSLILLLVKYKRSRVRWGMKTILSIVATILAFIALMAGVFYLELSGYRNEALSLMEDYVLGGAIAIYGLIIAIIAFL